MDCLLAFQVEKNQDHENFSDLPYGARDKIVALSVKKKNEAMAGQLSLF